MARKRANGKVKTNLKEAPQRLMPLSTTEAQYFNELVEASNQYSKILQQQTQFEYVTKQLKESRNKIQKGTIKMPVSLTLIPKVMTYPEGNKKEVLKIFDETIKNYVKSLQAINAQVDYRYETFVESGIRNREYLARRFKDATAKQITPSRVTIKDETTIFEAEIDKILDPKKTKEEYKKAKEAAIEHNKNLNK